MKKIGLRDNLAVERTHLANERTFLSYLRTGIAFGGAGFILLKFFPETIYSQLSIVFMAVGVLFFIYGILRFHKFHKHINAEGNGIFNK